jgi:hypothetical protein
MTALTVVVAMPLLGMSGIASAHVTKAAKHHHKAPAGGGSSTGSGSGGASPQIQVTVAPNPLVETGQSEVHAIIEVETLPSFAGDVVSVSSSQLNASCANVFYTSIADGDAAENPVEDEITAVLDDDGNVTVDVAGIDCAPGTSVVEADLEQAPYLTALTTLVANPPVVTAAGLTGYPNYEVETGDTTSGINGPSGDSDVYAIFYVEDNPVYAEQDVEIGSSQLEARCGGGWIWLSGNFGSSVTGTGANTNAPAETTLDDDGNAVFVFKGISCAAGDSQVIADVLAGTHDTFTFDYTIDPPAPTI